MKVARIRLIVAAVAFIGWLLYLGYLALGHATPVIVSRSQVLIATHFIKAELSVDDSGKLVPRAQVRDSFGSNRSDQETITIDNIADARLPGGKTIRSPGTFLLPLQLAGIEGHYKVAPSATGHGGETSPRQYWIYPWNGDVERQIRDFASKRE